jgi:hypothetical protein
MTKQFTERTLSNIAPSTGFNIKFAEHPEDQILHIVQQKEQVFWNDLPKNLRRTCRWTINLEKQGLIERVNVKGTNGSRRLLLRNAMQPHDIPGRSKCIR